MCSLKIASNGCLNKICLLGNRCLIPGTHLLSLILALLIYVFLLFVKWLLGPLKSVSFLWMGERSFLRLRTSSLSSLRTKPKYSSVSSYQPFRLVWIDKCQEAVITYGFKDFWADIYHNFIYKSLEEFVRHCISKLVHLGTKHLTFEYRGMNLIRWYILMGQAPSATSDCRVKLM